MNKKTDILELLKICCVLVIINITYCTLVSAITCTPTNLDNNNLNSNCTNNGLSTVLITTTGQGFSTNGVTSINPNSSSIITVSINSNAPTGNLGSILFDGVQVIQITNLQAPNTCNLNPSLSSLTQSVEQNTQYTLPKITFDPINCVGSVSYDASHIRVTGGVVLNGLSKPVSISSIVSDGVNLNVNTAGLNIQPYMTALEINAFGKTYQIPITIVVTNGASDSTTFECSKIPTCTITNSVMSLNNSNSLICSQIPSGVKVVPQVDSNYIIGTNVQQTNSQYIWYFKGIKNGISKVRASFTYLDAPVCSSFSQDVSIQSSGVVTGTNALKLIFTPDLSNAKPNQDIIIQIAETGSNSLIPNAQLMIDAIPLTVGNDSFTFHYSFVSNRNYTLRGLATGYADLVYNAYLSINPITFNMTPLSGDSDTQFDIRTIPENTSIFLDGNKINNPFISTISPGTHELRAIKEGYTDGVMNITINPAVFVTPSGEFKKGILQVFTLNKNSSCSVNYQKDSTSQIEIILPEQLNVDKLQFTPNKAGTYSIICNGIPKYTQTLTGWNWNKKWWFMSWYLWFAIPIGLFVLIKIFKNKSSGGMSVPIGG
jgi:hypothetical protein